MIIRMRGQDSENTPRKPKKIRSNLFLTVTNLLMTLVFALVYYYFKLPAINLKNPDFYRFFLYLAAFYCVVAVARKAGWHHVTGVKDAWDRVKSCCMIPAILCGALVLLFIVGSIISSPILRAPAYSRLLETEVGDFAEDIDEISFDQIPMLDENSANTLANRKLGELSDLVSQFEVNWESFQINYQNRPVRVTYLNYGDVFKWLKNTGSGVPAYMVVDMVTQEVSVQRLNEGIRYSPSELFFRYVERYLRFQYPTLMFADVNFEINEEGEPYWVASVITKRIGLFGGEDVIGAVLLNAVTGESAYYDAANIPTWVDRVYTADLIMQQYDYYGRYLNGFINSLFTQSGCTATTGGYNYIAQNDDVWVYTGITSVGGDESNIGFILVNQRTKEAKYYAIPGAIEYSAQDSAQGAVQQYSYKATFPLLLNIEGQPTYFMALKDASQLVKMYAMVNVEQYQIVATASTLAACEDNYVQLLRDAQILEETVPEAPPTVPDTVFVQGTVTEIRSAVIDGNTHYYLLLDNASGWYVLSVNDAPLAAILNVGDSVAVETNGVDGTLIPGYGIERIEIATPPVEIPEAVEN